MHDRNGNVLKSGDVVLVEAVVTQVSPGDDYCNVTIKTVDGRRPDVAKETISAINTGVVTLFRSAAVAALLVALLVGLSGCESANASVVTEADRAAAAADLAYIAAADAGPVWRPVDDVATPIDREVPALPATPSRLVPITVAIDDGGRPAIDVGILPTCLGWSCGSRDDADDDRRRPIREAIAATGRTVAAGGRVVQRAQPVRRIGGFLFRRNG